MNKKKYSEQVQVWWMLVLFPLLLWDKKRNKGFDLLNNVLNQSWHVAILSVAYIVQSQRSQTLSNLSEKKK